MRVAVYGNSIVDDFDGTQRIGGIGNISRVDPAYDLSLIGCVGLDNLGQFFIHELSKTNHDFVIHVDCGSATSSAIVETDKEKCTRRGIMTDGACVFKNDWVPVEADWHHILYLDKLDVDLSCFSGVISADVTDHIALGDYVEQLRFVDYLFLAAEVVSDFVPLGKCGTIIHSPERVWSVGLGVPEFFPEKVANLNVVGAGDYFSAFCIESILMGRLNFEYACHKTLGMLRKQS